MTQTRLALQDEYAKVGRLYHNRKKPRNLHTTNTIFVALLIIIILLPIKWYWIAILCIPLVLGYGAARIVSLNK
ncbi:hypothetical protein HOC35_07050 [Candidatus Woesearchaeota archaeon]|jgi:hypothetical protein|nr:hypothetical protein [Candidatus Woesearchaeota archaeon]